MIIDIPGNMALKTGSLMPLIAHEVGHYFLHYIFEKPYLSTHKLLQRQLSCIANH